MKMDCNTIQLLVDYPLLPAHFGGKAQLDIGLLGWEIELLNLQLQDGHSSLLFTT